MAWIRSRWVPSNVNGNFEAIAVWLQYGEESDADKFYAETNAKAVDMGLTWFFQEVKPYPVRN